MWSSLLPCSLRRPSKRKELQRINSSNEFVDADPSHLDVLAAFRFAVSRCVRWRTSQTVPKACAAVDPPGRDRALHPRCQLNKLNPTKRSWSPRIYKAEKDNRRREVRRGEDETGVRGRCRRPIKTGDLIGFGTKERETQVHPGDMDLKWDRWLAFTRLAR